MEVIVDRCGALDVHKGTIMAVVRLPASLETICSARR